MKKELNIFLNALMYYSRIPVPRSTECTDKTLSRAFRYFPLVGIIVGGLGGGCFVLANMVAPVSVSILIALAAMMLLTGCIHEDGFADFFDGFGGGRSKESILRIMKDSHIGTYGVIALIMLLAFKYASMQAISVNELPFMLIAAHSISRVYPVLLVRYSYYVRKEDSKAGHTRRGVDGLSLVVAILIGFSPPLLCFHYSFFILYLLLSFVLFIAFRTYLHKRIGGFTGDTLGALQQLMELLYYFTYIVWAGLSIW